MIGFKAIKRATGGNARLEFAHWIAVFVSLRIVHPGAMSRRLVCLLEEPNHVESHPHAWCRTAPEYPQVGEALEDPLAIAAKSSWVLDDVRVRGKHESPIFVGCRWFASSDSSPKRRWIASSASSPRSGKRCSGVLHCSSQGLGSGSPCCSFCKSLFELRVFAAHGTRSAVLPPMLRKVSVGSMSPDGIRTPISISCWMLRPLSWINLWRRLYPMYRRLLLRDLSFKPPAWKVRDRANAGARCIGGSSCTMSTRSTCHRSAFQNGMSAISFGTMSDLSLVILAASSMASSQSDPPGALFATTGTHVFRVGSRASSACLMSPGLGTKFQWLLMKIKASISSWKAMRRLCTACNKLATTPLLAWLCRRWSQANHRTQHLEHLIGYGTVIVHEPGHVFQEDRQDLFADGLVWGKSKSREVHTRLEPVPDGSMARRISLGWTSHVIPLAALCVRSPIPDGATNDDFHSESVLVGFCTLEEFCHHRHAPFGKFASLLHLSCRFDTTALQDHGWKNLQRVQGLLLSAHDVNACVVSLYMLYFWWVLLYGFQPERRTVRRNLHECRRQFGPSDAALREGSDQSKMVVSRQKLCVGKSRRLCRIQQYDSTVVPQLHGRVYVDCT
ncbi:unnamed protein product [Darwinula stevensoni]|uniref:Uncharacterized protein n=1 Tax=Darwinula stevensoni TaxID=69355 RepID=A0A7R9AD71_9CRUS|nr:unnamed protein product [Darwinula stevensoni]CAG0900794.1 unnamed protein product [Darwinula stevensoni]